jgi:hypothetical protein
MEQNIVVEGFRGTRNGSKMAIVGKKRLWPKERIVLT